MRPVLNLENQKFGRLTAINIAFKKNRNYYWNCKCDCGNQTVVCGTKLKKGKIISCGCYLKERFIDTHRKYKGGERVGKLTILEYNKDFKKYKCQCDCGKIIYKDIGYLSSHGAKYGCGCFLKIDGQDIVGKKISHLIVVSTAYYRKTWHYNCICDCGEKLIRSRDVLLAKSEHFCNKCSKKYLGQRNSTHNMTRKTPLYGVWLGMKRRCYNVNNEKYPCYGAKNITVCDEWKDNFSEFYKWAILSGYTKGLTIDRINVYGNYEPSNCRWADYKQQANNKTNNIYLTLNGVEHTISEWCDILHFPYSTLRGRVRLGWTDEQILTTPKRKIKRMAESVG